MRKLALILAAAPAALLLTAAAPAKRMVTYTLPAEPQFTLPKGEGAELAQGTCSACHSLDYIQMQPRGKGYANLKNISAPRLIPARGPPPSRRPPSGCRHHGRSRPPPASCR